MAKIIALDSITIDKIAAGEVVESPAACIKELIENSLDAGATELIIEIELGGRQKIEIQDNGSGISREDLSLAVQRFATSKIATIDDLEKLSTMGFRGEALSAISSVSQMKIVTSDAAQGNSPLFTAYELCVDGGVLSPISSALRQKGTTISVQSLFYNVPARRKFLRPPSKEAYEITRVVQAIALSNPHVAFKLMHDGVLELNLPPESLQERILRFFGSLEKHDLIPLNWDSEDLSISGYICSPKHLRANRTGQFLSINSRPVHSLPISYAIRDGFGPACDTNKYPYFFIQLQMNPATVDVNIHPQKREVRIYQEEWVKRQLSDQVAKAILGFVEPLSIQPQLFQSSYTTPASNASSSVSTALSSTTVSAPFFSSSSTGYSLPSTISSTPFELPAFEEPKEDRKATQLQFDAVRYSIVSVQQDYAFLLLDEKMAVVSLKELYRKVAFLNFSKRAQRVQVGTLESYDTQLLLTPVLIRLSLSESKQLETLLPELNRCGFLLRPFGNTSFYIDAVPKELESLDIEKFISELLEEGVELIKILGKVEKMFFEKLSLVATKHVKRGANLQLILDILFKAEGPYLSLSGKPLIHTFSQTELERFFQQVE